MSESPSADATAVVRTLVARRGPGKTVCPSEVARALAGAGGDWRPFMPRVHAAVDELVAQGAVALSWHGDRLVRRDGPYRIGIAE